MTNEKEKSGYNFKQSVKMAINDVNESINEINKILNEVKTAKDYHETLYLNRWRKTNCDAMIQSLKLANGVLNLRFTDLERFLIISKYTD